MKLSDLRGYQYIGHGILGSFDDGRSVRLSVDSGYGQLLVVMNEGINLVDMSRHYGDEVQLELLYFSRSG